MLSFLVMWLVGRRVEGGEQLGVLSLTWRTVVAGALVPLGVALLSTPTSLFNGDVTAQAAVFSIEIAIFDVIAIPTLIAQWRRVRRDDHAHTTAPNLFVGVFGALYLGG